MSPIFKNGAGATAFLLAMQGLPSLYKKVVGYELDLGPGGDAVAKDRVSGPPVEGANNIVTQYEKVDSDCFACEGGSLSRALNQAPGINAVAGVHDVMQISMGSTIWRDVLNVPGMIPAAAFTYSAALGLPLEHLRVDQILDISATYSRNEERDSLDQSVHLVGH